jgi:hypothetical protein
MKTVFSSTSEVCHVFAQRVQTEGRAGNVFFEGNVIYSYGYHYELARFFQGANNQTAILINDRGYSVSTAKHIGRVRAATSHFTQFNFTETDGKAVLSELESLAKKMIKARKPEIYINQANNLLDSYIEYCNFTGKEHELHNMIIKAYDVFSTGKVKEYFESKESELKKIEREKAKKEKLQLKKDIKDFLNHKKNFVDCRQNNESFVRLSKDGEKVETSKGVKVDAKDAKKLYQLIKAGKDIKGYKIDYYTVISLNDVLKIGCHDINVKNMHEVGEKLLQM